MKKRTKLFTLIGTTLLGLTACSGGVEGGSLSGAPKDGGGSYYDSDSDSFTEGGYFEDDSSIGPRVYDGEEESGRDGESKKEEQIQAGKLTAKALFDNDPGYYEYLCALLNKDEQSTGEFASFQEKFNLNYKRTKVTVKNVPYAKVDLLDKNNRVVWSSIANAKGECYLFSNKGGEKISVTVGSETKLYDFKESVIVEDFTESTLKYNKIQVLFNIDTTGSMGDEITYLKAELQDVITRIEDETNAKAQVGILVYRDTDDTYVTQHSDFSDDLDASLDYLKRQFAAGGGDFEEAVQESYNVAKQFTWAEDATKVIVHVADAPSHDSDVQSWFNSVKYFSEMGAHILTVASSGIDKKTEYLFRMQSLQTNGCYAFLTDDSGIGDSHLEASVLDDLPVEPLNDLLVRVIKGFHNGEVEESKVFDISSDPEFLYLNKKIHVSKDVQLTLVKKYIDQFAEEKQGAKAGIKLFYLYKNIPFVYMDDNFIEADDIETVEVFGDIEIKYPDNKRKILAFNGRQYISLQEALENDLIPFSVVKDLYNFYLAATTEKMPVE